MLAGKCSSIGVFLSSALACSTPDEPAPAPSPRVGGAGGAGGAPGSSTEDPSESEWSGTFRLRLLEETDFRDAKTVVDGRVYDGGVPNTTPLSVEQEEGPCQLRVVDLPFCTSPCESGDACVADDICSPYPSVIGVGPVYVDGLANGQLILEEFPPSYQYLSGDLPLSPCVPGDGLSLSSNEFAITSTCIAPLVMDQGAISVARGESVRLHWEPSEEPDGAKIEILLDLSRHGGKKGDIFCQVADRGTLEIPESIVNPLIDLGLAGFPSVIIRRLVSSRSTRHPGIFFQVVSSVERAVDTGVISCTRDEQCPEGTTCDTSAVICR